MRLLIADDDPLVTDLLQHHAEKLAPGSETVVVHDGSEALEVAQAGNFDLLVLDLQMPGTDGREVLQAVGDEVPVIIVTGDPDFAVEAFRLNVVDYIVKPVTFERFAQAWRKVKERKVRSGDEAGRSIVFVRTGTDIVRVDLGDVRFIKSESNYVRFHLEGREIQSLMNMKDLELKLPPGFVRVHRSYIVNLRHIEKLDSMDIKIGRELIPVSETYRPELLKRLDLL